jgi:cytochrome c-type biogenesis protein CcmH/NrfG
MAKFFHLQKSKGYSYKPRYYNEQDELRKKREARIIKEIEAEKSGTSKNISKESMTNYLKIARNTQKKSNIRLLVILVILFLISYFFFF